MHRSGSSLLITPFVVLLGLLLTGTHLFAQQAAGSAKPLIVLTKLTAPPHDPVAESLSSAITSSIGVVLRMTESLRVERADFLLPTVGFQRSLQYYRQVGANGAVYGTVRPQSNGGYVIELDLWDSARPQAGPRVIRRDITNILSSFSAADTIALAAASTIVGHKLSMGTLVIANLGSLPRYSVYADGQLLGRNRATFQVLTGKRTIIIAKPGVLGDVPVETFHVRLREGATTTITYTPPEKAVPATARPIGPAAAPTPSTGDQVYIAGEVGGRPVYWRNGVLHRLPLSGSADQGWADAIAVDRKGNVYVAGALGAADNPFPVYWRNGKVFTLPTIDYTFTGEATSIAIDPAGSVFVAGHTGRGISSIPVYWENREAHALPGSGGGQNLGGAADAVTVGRDGIAYFAGRIGRAIYSTAAAWPGSKLTYLFEGSDFADTHASSIAVDGGGNLFIAGSAVSSAADNPQVAVLWDNGWLSQLATPKGVARSGATSVRLDDRENLYIGGFAGSTPVYWLNNELHALPSDERPGEVRAISLDAGGNLYLAGWIGREGNEAPVYWLDGRLHHLPEGSTGAHGRATSIVVIGGHPHSPASGLKLGRLSVVVAPTLKTNSQIGLSLSGRGTNFTARGIGAKPWVLTVKPGTYSFTASLSGDPAPGYRTTVTVPAGGLVAVRAPLDYSAQYRLDRARQERTLLQRRLAALTRGRSSKTVLGVIFDGVGVLGGIGAGVFGYLAATSAGSSNVGTYKAAAIGAGIAGAISLVVGISVQSSGPAAATITGLEIRIGRLDDTIASLNKVILDKVVAVNK